eukprot:COSAG03_NODE_894_length_5464_cov_8.128984_1_plen_218_part_10
MPTRFHPELDAYVELPLACAVAAAYVLLGLAGNRFMAGRPPLQLTVPKLLYNSTQVVVCSITFVKLMPFFTVRQQLPTASRPLRVSSVSLSATRCHSLPLCGRPVNRARSMGTASVSSRRPPSSTGCSSTTAASCWTSATRSSWCWERRRGSSRCCTSGTTRPSCRCLRTHHSPCSAHICQLSANVDVHIFMTSALIGHAAAPLPSPPSAPAVRFRLF